MDYSGFNLSSVQVERGVALVNLDNLPVNLFTLELAEELFELAAMVTNDDAVRVIVFQSANPDFFIAHMDVNLIGSLPAAREVAAASSCWHWTCVSRRRARPC